MSTIPLPSRVRLLFGGKSTLIGWGWIAVLSWFMVMMATWDIVAPAHSLRVPGRINAVTESTIYGERYYIADFYYRERNGEVATGRSMSKTEPAVGEHEVAFDGDTPILVGMMMAREPLPIGFMLFTLIGFVLMSFEVVGALRTFRAVRAGAEPPVAADWRAYFLLVLPLVAMTGFVRALYYFVAFR